MKPLFAAVLLFAAPAAAETVLELRVGPVVLEAGPEDIAEVALTEGYPPGFQLGLTEAFSAEIAAFTGAHIGDQARLSICGEVVSRPVIQERIAGPNLMVTDIAPELVQPFLLALVGQAACPEAGE